MTKWTVVFVTALMWSSMKAPGSPRASRRRSRRRAGRRPGPPPRRSRSGGPPSRPPGSGTAPRRGPRACRQVGRHPAGTPCCAVRAGHAPPDRLRLQGQLDRERPEPQTVTVVASVAIARWTNCAGSRSDTFFQSGATTSRWKRFTPARATPEPGRAAPTWWRISRIARRPSRAADSGIEVERGARMRAGGSTRALSASPRPAPPPSRPSPCACRGRCR